MRLDETHVPSTALRQVIQGVDHYRDRFFAVRPWGEFPGQVDADDATTQVLRLAMRLSDDTSEAVDRTAWHLAVVGLWCQLPAYHHSHTDEPAVWAPDVPLLLALDAQDGTRSIRELAGRYGHLGADRNMARHVLRQVAPADEAPQDEQVPDGKRRDRRYTPLSEVSGSGPARALMIATGRMTAF